MGIQIENHSFLQGPRQQFYTFSMMATSDDSLDSGPRRRVSRHYSNDSLPDSNRSPRRGRVGRHPSYELQRSCDRDTHVTNLTGDTLGSMSDDKDDAEFALAPDLADRLVK